MKKAKKTFSILLAIMLVLTLALAGCGNNESASGGGGESGSQGGGKTVKLVAAHVTPVDGPYQKGMEKFKEIVEQKTNGQITVEIHPNGELGGNEDELVQKMATGTVDLIVAAPGFLTQVVKEVDLFALPYLFASLEHWEKVVDGEVGQLMAQKIEEKTDFKVLGYWKAGVREYFGPKPVETPDDLKGVKIRVQNSPLINQFWQTLGAQPVAVAFNELYQALENGVVDAAENDFTNILLMKFHEVTPYISLTDHDIATRFFIMSDKKFQSLSDEQKQIIEEAAVEASKYERQVDDELAQKSLEQLEAEGAKINEVDKVPFIEATEQFRADAAKQLGLEDVLQKINDLK